MAKILVAMSGGVDSSVAALLLHAQGHRLAGVTMCLGTQAPSDSRPACCGPDAVKDARRVCDRLGIAHHVFDYAEELQRSVIAPFVGEYAAGRTPNPCIWCNSRLKFGTLLKKAHAMGFDMLATGHYARIVPDGSGHQLCCARDNRKDQTYFLYAIERQALSSIALPLADLLKEEVRALAVEARLPVAHKKESQDICFIPSGSYRDFLIQRVPAIPGNFVDTNGTVLGSHTGISHYTVGQRKGLGISAGNPLYVVAIRADNNTVILGERHDLLSEGLLATDANLLCDTLPPRGEVAIRYSAAHVPAHLALNADTLTVTFDTPQEAVTPGQAVVMYEADTVLGGATIRSALGATCAKHRRPA